jgi:thiol-disulfide isomerase/thioredoxin
MARPRKCRIKPAAVAMGALVWAIPAAAPHEAKQTAQATLAKQQTPDQELQQTIEAAGNDRVALVRNLEAFLKKYPEAQQRVPIYRALVEASLQLRDNARAADYAERIVALSPDDISMTMLTIQLLERDGDEAQLRRAKNYATRVLNFIDRNIVEKSPKISREEWEAERHRDRMNLLLLRGGLYEKLHELPQAQSDFEDSYELVPNAAAAEKLGEIAELKKDFTLAIHQYARAFALSDAASGSAGRREIRQKLGNVWRLTHSSEEGLGELTLRIYDEVSGASGNGKSQVQRNAQAKEPFEFTLRKADGSPFPLGEQKGKVLVVNFWATWCGPCRAQEPLFERVASRFQQSAEVLFLAADCDEDETLVPPYLKELKPKATVVFADGLDRWFGVRAFPTVVVIDRTGKVAYRTEGYGEDSFEQSLTLAVREAIGVVKSSAAASPNPQKP